LNERKEDQTILKLARIIVREEGEKISKDVKNTADSPPLHNRHWGRGKKGRLWEVK